MFQERKTCCHQKNFYIYPKAPFDFELNCCVFCMKKTCQKSFEEGVIALYAFMDKDHVLTDLKQRFMD